MALSDTFTPALFYFQIQQGQQFHLELPQFVDAATGAPFDFVADGGWVARMDVKTANGVLVVSFATSSANGVITLTADGGVQLDLAAAYTAALTPTATYSNQTTGGVLFADVVLVDPDDSQPRLWFTGRGQIRKQVTA